MRVRLCPVGKSVFHSQLEKGEADALCRFAVGERDAPDSAPRGQGKREIGISAATRTRCAMEMP